MSKIEKVKLTNFRVFSDKFNKVDFNNENGSPADFVCIYGQNGMGKTSFFDGIEWFSSGSIYRFEGNDIKKELKKYKGYILSNRNIDGNMDKSYVEVKYSDNCTVKRTVIRSTKEINEKGYRDYNKGRLNPNKFKMNIVNKQILPHDKIDSFIYAKSPSEKYEEWGNFWDIDGSQRKLFDKVYSVKRLITKRIESLEESYNKAIDDLKQLTVSDEKINEINNKIKEFNRTEEISKVKLKKLIKDENKITNVPTVSEIKKYKSRVNKMADTEILNREKIVYLIKFYKDYYSQKKTKLDTKIKNVKAQLDKYKDLNVVGDIWFEEYNQWRQLDSNLKLNNQQLKIKLESLNAKNEELGNICKKMEKCKESIEALNNEEQKFLCESKVIEKVIEELSDKQSKRKVNIDTLEKLNILKKQNKNKISNLEEAKIKDEKDDFDIHLISISEDDKKFLEFRKIYIDKYKNIIEEISKKSEAADKEKKIYNSCKNNFDELQKILIQVKGYIEKEKLSSCPVCHTPFNKVEILLSKINLDEQSYNCKKLYDKYQFSLSDKEKSLTKKKELISKWNEECEKYKASIGEENHNLAIQITSITYQNKMIEKSINLENGKINEFKEDLNKICKYEGKLSEVLVREWLNKIKITYKDKLSESKKEKDKIFKLITLLDKEIKDLKSKGNQLENKNDNFYKNDINKVLVSKLDEMNTTKNLSIKNWEDFKIYFNSLNKQSQKLEEENKELNNYIMEYKKYNYKNIL
ncbi:AAA family ATPase, partial [Clostridium tyrobutyricum]|uniref:AAA family ATPase n=1 Tax=Clostridium tyrobutyricum TaxID=1519 RepID=UPI001C3CA5F0